MCLCNRLLFSDSKYICQINLQFITSLEDWLVAAVHIVAERWWVIKILKVMTLTHFLPPAGYSAHYSCIHFRHVWNWAGQWHYSEVLSNWQGCNCKGLDFIFSGKYKVIILDRNVCGINRDCSTMPFLTPNGYSGFFWFFFYEMQWCSISLLSGVWCF